MKTIVKFIILSFFICLYKNGYNQASINLLGSAPHSSAGLDIDFSNKGLLIPRISLSQTTSSSPITSPATSLLVYNTQTINDVTPGFYYWDGTKWLRLFDANTRPWLLNGNSGTNALTDFLGTTDSQPLIIKTNNTERARILSSGNVLINRTTLTYATDLFEVQGNSSYPDAINGFTDQANGIAVSGINSTATGAGNGTGVYGSSLQTNSAGVRGEGSTATRGVLGITNNATYAGVQGQNQNGDGDAIVGINAATSGSLNGTGIFGQCSQGGGAAAGVYGYNDNNAGAAIIGYNAAAAGTGNGKGVVGYTNQSGSSAAGVYAINANASGEGLIAFNSAASGTNMGDAIYGQTAQSQGFAMFGTNTHTSGTGVVGSGNNQTASYLTNGSGGAFTGNTIGVYGKAISSANSTFGGYFINGNANGYAYIGGTDNVGTVRKVIGPGTVSTIVSDTKGNKVTMSCPEAPEILFMDFGHAKLQNGRAYVKIDPILSKNILVDEQHPLKVFIQLEGDCKGVYVTNKSKEGFEVIELQDGTSNVPFTWSIVAQRADEYDENGNLISKNVNRFPPAMLPMEVSSKPIRKLEYKPGEFEQNSKKERIVQPIGKR
ncbi:MAG: hypothetical protein N2449_10185 [Bacteroidales bacterium]|nr:hypothetical protein [Bacteroidales bacterium]